jgi:hypothetical protein
MCKPIPQHAFDKRKDYGRVDLDVSLVVVVRLDRDRVVAETEPEVGFAERGAQERDLCFVREMLLVRMHCTSLNRSIEVSIEWMGREVRGWI